MKPHTQNQYEAKVLRVTSGTSFECQFDLGFGVILHREISLAGVKVNGFVHDRAKMWLIENIGGRTVIIHTCRNSADEGAWVELDSVIINDKMVAEGILARL